MADEDDKTKTPDQKPPETKTDKQDLSGLASKTELDDFRDQIGKARSQEREKVQADMTSLKSTNSVLEKELAEIKAELAKTVRLPDPAPSPEMTVGDVSASLASSQAEIAALREEMATRDAKEKTLREELFAETKRMLAESQAEAFREKALREAKLGALEKYVQGTTREEIQESIDAVKELKKGLAKEAQEELRKEFEEYVPKAIGVDHAKKLLRDAAPKLGTAGHDVSRNRQRVTPEQRKKDRAAQLAKVKR